MADLRRRVTMDTEADFSDLVGHTERPVEVIAYFLALLELARWGIVEVTQSGWLAEIRVKAAVVDLTIESEWE
jgi:chromatin segregation and condensation protein Rec8/ScpA/Scc1 (kleisin family)